jgi:hypothetical protein
MSKREDRVAVPTNGHRPALGDGDPAADLADTSDLGSGMPSFSIPTLRPTVPPVSPAQAAVGFGIIAALILLLLGRRRGGRR